MKLLHSLALAALIALPAAFPAGAQDDTPPPPRPDRGAEATPAAKPDGVEAPLTKDLAGPYLAGRVAATDSDFAAAAYYYLRALKQDPSSQFLSDGALVSLLASGQVEAPVPTFYFTQLLAVALGVAPESCLFDLNDAASLALLKNTNCLVAA